METITGGQSDITLQTYTTKYSHSVDSVCFGVLSIFLTTSLALAYPVGDRSRTNQEKQDIIKSAEIIVGVGGRKVVRLLLELLVNIFLIN
jgi:hypothetical protein